MYFQGGRSKNVKSTEIEATEEGRVKQNPQKNSIGHTNTEERT